MSSGVLLGRRFHGVDIQYLLWDNENKSVDWVKISQLEEKSKNGMSILGLPKRFPNSEIRINVVDNIYFSKLYDYVEEVTYVIVYFGLGNPVAYAKVKGYWTGFVINSRGVRYSGTSLVISASAFDGFVLPDERTSHPEGINYNSCFCNLEVVFDLVNNSVTSSFSTNYESIPHKIFPFVGNRFVFVDAFSNEISCDFAETRLVLDKKYRKYFYLNDSEIGQEIISIDTLLHYLEKLGMYTSELKCHLDEADRPKWCCSVVIDGDFIDIILENDYFGKVVKRESLDIYAKKPEKPHAVERVSVHLPNIMKVERFNNSCVPWYLVTVAVGGLCFSASFHLSLYSMLFMEQPNRWKNLL